VHNLAKKLMITLVEGGTWNETLTKVFRTDMVRVIVLLGHLPRQVRSWDDAYETDPSSTDRPFVIVIFMKQSSSFPQGRFVSAAAWGHDGRYANPLASCGSPYHTFDATQVVRSYRRPHGTGRLGGTDRCLDESLRNFWDNACPLA